MKSRRALVAAGFVLLALECCFPGRAAENKIAELQARFDRETNSIQKEKAFEKLSSEQFAEAGRAAKQDDYQTVGLLMEKYRDNLRETLKGLKSQHPNAEKHPGGYRNLEIRVRGNLRDIDDFLLVAPPEYRPPLSLVRKDVDDVEEELLHLLFPARPGEKPIREAPPKRQ